MVATAPLLDAALGGRWDCPRQPAPHRPEESPHPAWGWGLRAPAVAEAGRPQGLGEAPAHQGHPC